MPLHNDISLTLPSLIKRRIKAKGLSRHDLVSTLGYKNISKGCRKLDNYLTSLHAPSDEFIVNLLSILGINGLEFHNAINGSVNNGNINADRRAKEHFTPYIRLLARITITPFFVRQILYNEHCIQKLPENIQKLPLGEEVSYVISVYRAKLKNLLKNVSSKHIYPEESGFEYYRHYNSYMEFDANGTLVELTAVPPIPDVKKPLGNQIVNMLSGGLS